MLAVEHERNLKERRRVSLAARVKSLRLVVADKTIVRFLE
jgi:hypothetical protein